jgi:acyl-CoA thioester hydrolase
MGVVYHGNYLRLFEIARTELLRSIGLPYSVLEDSGYMLPVLESYAKYILPARYDDLLALDAQIVRAVSASFTISYQILRDDVTLVYGWTRHAFVTADQFKPIRPPKVFIDTVMEAV